MLPRRTGRFHSAPRIAWLAFPIVYAATIGCASSLSPEGRIYESERGGVYLEAIPDRHLQAAHPVSLPPETVSRTLRGVLVRDRDNADRPARAFSDEEVMLFTPLIVEALSQATPAQQVRFRIVHLPQRERSIGRLYVYGLSLYLTMTEYRLKTGKDPVSQRGPGGMGRVEFLFTPQTALRPESFRQTGSREGSFPPLVIDYDLLGRLPSSLLGPSPLSDVSRESVPESGPQKEGKKATSSEELQSELQAVKEELRAIKKQLTEQEAERDKQKKKKAP